MLGKDRMAFSYRYCNRRLIPVGRQGSNTKKYDNFGLSRAGELHALLKEVGSLWHPQLFVPCMMYSLHYFPISCMGKRGD